MAERLQPGFKYNKDGQVVMACLFADSEARNCGKIQVARADAAQVEPTPYMKRSEWVAEAGRRIGR